MSFSNSSGIPTCSPFYFCLLIFLLLLISLDVSLNVILLVCVFPSLFVTVRNIRLYERQVSGRHEVCCWRPHNLEGADFIQTMPADVVDPQIAVWGLSYNERATTIITIVVVIITIITVVVITACNHDIITVVSTICFHFDAHGHIRSSRWHACLFAIAIVVVVVIAITLITIIINRTLT